ncbi:hypothetical protein CDD83_10252 [Cordyceps sp. RAO-2017]|nr:hypothetical protein CDD83_10252 [Cordyceps sp. RAO-2017]
MEQPEDDEAHAASGTAEESEAAELTESESRRHGHRRRRVGTVYDAAAGKVWPDQASAEQATTGFIKHSTRRTPLAPDELLFRRKRAPERYADHDVYRAHERDLPRGGRGVLPESDLLKAIHGYASRFYGALARRGNDARGVDECSMDETALLAFGILLEEAGREVLGRRGDLVFTEAADGDEVAPHDHPGGSFVGRDRDAAAGRLPPSSPPPPPPPPSTTTPESERRPKRRKLVKDEGENADDRDGRA